MQQLNSTGTIIVKDSVLWPSWDKVFQSDEDFPGSPYRLINVWASGPAYIDTYWGAGAPTLSGNPMASADITCDGCTLSGGINVVHGPFPICNSELYQVSNYNETGCVGSNTTRTSIGQMTPPIPMSAFSTAYLDSVWSP
jgi:hypothetical protein